MCSPSDLSIVSSNENTPIPHGETIVLGLMTALKNNSEANSDPKLQKTKQSEDGFNFSTVQVNKSDNEIAQLDVAPYINFLKGDFHFPSIKEGVKLKNDIIVIVWRTKNGRTGLSHAPITSEDFTVSVDSVDGVPGSNPTSDVFSSTDSVDSPVIPVVKKPCRVRATVLSKNIQVRFFPIFETLTLIFNHFQ